MDDKIISFADRKKKVESDKEPKKDSGEYDFALDVERNKALAERKAKERLAANKGVLRSYRIKN